MSRAERKQQTRQRILEAAGRGFRKGGFGGAGVDGLAKEAGVTSGAFYTHFDSKAAAFRESVVVGMEGLKGAIQHLQSEHGREWWGVFVRFYLGEKRSCELAESCVLQSLSPEVARAESSTRAEFEAMLLDVATCIIEGPVSDHAPSDLGQALQALATLVGAVTLSRAVAGPAMAEQIAVAAEHALLPGS